jgi:ferritin-like metal-binding protein YciE
MGIRSLKDLYLEELADLYDAETQMIKTLPRLVELAHSQDLRQALGHHCAESRLHLERLQLIFTHWGERVRSHACAGIAGIVQEAYERLNEPATPDALDAEIIGIAQRMEHYEMAAYGCARTYARRLNRSDEARLLQETLNEEGRADRRLTEIAEAHVNDGARSEEDREEPRPVSSLRFIEARTLGEADPSAAPLGVRNDADVELGVLDGIIVDRRASTPRYIVVKSGGLFSGRRYLLPIHHVRFDQPDRVLRVDLDKSIAVEYPPFNRDEFEAMSVERLCDYEARLREFFPRQPRHQWSPGGETTHPDWLGGVVRLRQESDSPYIA